jgi:hypothetical protein
VTVVRCWQLRQFRATRIKWWSSPSRTPRGKAAVFPCCNSRASIRMPNTNSVGLKAKPCQKLLQALQVRGGCNTVCSWTCAEITRPLRSGWMDNAGARFSQRRRPARTSICLCGGPIDLGQTLLQLFGFIIAPEATQRLGLVAERPYQAGTVFARLLLHESGGPMPAGL